MTVEELIEILKGYNPQLPVVYRCYSEQVLLEEREILVEEHSLPRADGWVEDKRPDKPHQQYLLFPGN